jgi:hypothetical protein
MSSPQETIVPNAIVKKPELAHTPLPAPVHPDGVTAAQTQGTSIVVVQPVAGTPSSKIKPKSSVDDQQGTPQLRGGGDDGCCFCCCM